MSSVHPRKVKLLYFAWVREKIGRGSEEIALPDNVATVADLVAWLKTRGPEFGEAFARADVVRAALDKTHVKSDARIGEAQEIAFFPPVTGG
ncbi:MAG: molybdopterin converting factor subunit 1 [Hyphomicrobium sp.]